MTTYVYRHTHGDPYTVGFYDPKGNWHPESDHDTREEAAARVNYLNGGGDLPDSIKWALNSGDGTYRP